MKKMLLCLLALIAVAPAWGENDAPISLGIVIDLKGASEDVFSLIAKLKKAPVYKAAVCEIANESQIVCAKVNGGLMVFLDKNAPATVEWSISGSGSRPCPGTPGCQVMHCPPPNGPTMCCHPKSPYGAC